MISHMPPPDSAPQIIHVDLELDNIIKAIKDGTSPSSSNSSSAQAEVRDMNPGELTRPAPASAQGMDLYYILTYHVVDRLLMPLPWHCLIPYEG